MSYEDFHKIFMNVLDKHAPMEKKIVRVNNAPFMTKALSKQIMRRSKLKILSTKNPLMKTETCIKNNETCV